MSEEPFKRVGGSPPSTEASGEASAGEDFTPPPVSTSDTAEQIIQKLREENRQLADQLLRKQADIENVKKRLAREKEEFQKFSLAQAIQALLPILDGFELALKSDATGEDYRRGVEIIYLQFLGTLQRMGLETIEAVGKRFDPNLHEAIAAVETDEYPDQQVVDEMQRGYFFKQRLLRPARVRVAKRASAGDDFNAQPE
jgi:molecular chaperone GrpE